MRRLPLILITLLAAMDVEFAQGTKIATATSSAPFQLKGAAVNPAGAPLWPVMAGDEVAALSAPVTLTFADGTKIGLAPGSRAKLESENGTPVFRLLDGEALYDLKDEKAVKLFALDKQVKVSGARGTYSLGGAKAAAGTFWTAKTTALVLAAGAGAGVGIGVAASQDDKPSSVSPRR